MHINSLGCPKILPLSAPGLYWFSHLTCNSSLKAKNERKTLIYTQPNKSRCNQQFFAIFRRILRTYLRPIYCSLTCSSVARASDRHAAEAGSIPRCGEGFYFFSPESTFSADSLTVSVQTPCAIACSNICANVKDAKHWQLYLCLDHTKIPLASSG